MLPTSMSSVTGSKGPKVIWTDRCKCKHVAASHGPTKTRNLEGACLIPLCVCGAFKAVTV